MDLQPSRLVDLLSTWRSQGARADIDYTWGAGADHLVLNVAATLEALTRDADLQAADDVGHCLSPVRREHLPVIYVRSMTHVVASASWTALVAAVDATAAVRAILVRDAPTVVRATRWYAPHTGMALRVYEPPVVRHVLRPLVRARPVDPVPEAATTATGKLVTKWAELACAWRTLPSTFQVGGVAGRVEAVGHVNDNNVRFAWLRTTAVRRPTADADHGDTLMRLVRLAVAMGWTTVTVPAASVVWRHRPDVLATLLGRGDDGDDPLDALDAVTAAATTDPYVRVVSLVDDDVVDDTNVTPTYDSEVRLRWAFGRTIPPPRDVVDADHWIRLHRLFPSERQTTMANGSPVTRPLFRLLDGGCDARLLKPMIDGVVRAAAVERRRVDAPTFVTLAWPIPFGRLVVVWNGGRLVCTAVEAEGAESLDVMVDALRTTHFFDLLAGLHDAVHDTLDLVAHRDLLPFFGADEKWDATSKDFYSRTSRRR
jgi:hypothetical protein